MLQRSATQHCPAQDGECEHHQSAPPRDFVGHPEDLERDRSFRERRPRVERRQVRVGDVTEVARVLERQSSAETLRVSTNSRASLTSASPEGSVSGCEAGRPGSLTDWKFVAFTRPASVAFSIHLIPCCPFYD